MKYNTLFKRPDKKLENQNVFTVNGATGHTNKPREVLDYYATQPKCVQMLLEETGETFAENIWECAVGGGAIAEVLKAYGHKVKCSDIVDRGYPGTEILNVYNQNKVWNGDIISNPPL